MLPIEGADDAGGKCWGFYSSDDGDDDYFDPTVEEIFDIINSIDIIISISIILFITVIIIVFVNQCYLYLLE